MLPSWLELFYTVSYSSDLFLWHPMNQINKINVSTFHFQSEKYFLRHTWNASYHTQVKVMKEIDLWKMYFALEVHLVE